MIRPRRTQEDWAAVARENPLALATADAIARLRDVMLDRYSFMILTGDAGLGKSWMINQAIVESERQAIKVEVGQYRDLRTLFDKAARAGRLPLVFEEADNLFKSERQANVLKKATDTDLPNRIVTISETIEVFDPDAGANGKMVRRRVTREIDLNTPVIITSNNNIHDLNSFDRTMREHMKALRSRAGGNAIHISASRHDQWEYTSYLAVCHALTREVERHTRREERFRAVATKLLNLTDGEPHSVEWFPASVGRPTPRQVGSPQQDLALRWFTDNALRLQDAYPRTLKEIIKAVALYPTGWEAKLQNLIRDPDAPTFRPPAGAYPHIFQRALGYCVVDGERITRPVRGPASPAIRPDPDPDPAQPDPEPTPAAPRSHNLIDGRRPKPPKLVNTAGLPGCTYIYPPAGQAGEYAPLACNPYRGCGHKCAYCYVPQTTKQPRPDFNAGAVERPTFRAGLLKDARKYQAAGIREQVMLSFTTDPYPPPNPENTDDPDHLLTRWTLETLADHGLGFCTLTKGGSRALRDIDLFRPDRDAFASTLTSLDPAFSRKWEGAAADPEDRIATLKAFHDRGIYTWVSLEPTLDVEASLEIVEFTHPYVDLYKVGQANYLKEITRTTDWADYTFRMIDKLNALGVAHYIKQDLQPYLPEGYPNPLRVQQHH